MTHSVRRWLLVSSALLFVGCVGPRREVTTRTVAQRADGFDVLDVDVAEGDLDVVGDPSATEVRMDATLATHLLGRGDDVNATEALSVTLDEQDGHLRALVRLDGAPAGYFADVVLHVPSRLALNVRDSAGDIIVSDVASLGVDDGAGDLDVSNVAGAVRIDDGSGDIRLTTIGALTLTDDSGGIDVHEVDGDVELHDASGDITLDGVTGGVMVEDGSGELACAHVGGDMDITDGSGGIHLEHVGGTARIVDGSGDIVAIDVGDVNVVSDGSGNVDIR